MGEVEPLSDEVGWGAKAAAGDALSRVENDSSFVALWVTAAGQLHYSKTDLSPLHAAALAKALDVVASDVMSDVLEE